MTGNKSEIFDLTDWNIVKATVKQPGYNISTSCRVSTSNLIFFLIKINSKLLHFDERLTSNFSNLHEKQA